MRTTSSAALALLLACATSAARGEDSAAAPAIGFPGRLGLAGFQDMVDARTPGGALQVRGGASYAALVQDRDFRGAIEEQRREVRHELSLYAGAAALGMVDVGLMMPYVWEDLDADLVGARDYGELRHGWGDLEAAAKVSIEIGPVVLAPFLRGRFPTAEPAVEQLAEGEYGVAGTFSLLNEYVSVHGNLAGLQQEEGLSAIRYRVGAAFVVWADHLAVVRVYGYGDMIEYEGHANSDIELDCGVQAQLLSYVYVELGATVRLIDADRIDDELRDDLSAHGALDDHFDDEGTWGLRLSVGFIW